MGPSSRKRRDYTSMSNFNGECQKKNKIYLDYKETVLKFKLWLREFQTLTFALEIYFVEVLLKINVSLECLGTAFQELVYVFCSCSTVLLFLFF